MKRRAAALAATLAMAAALAAPARADLTIVAHSYRTGPFAAAGAPGGDGFADYMTLLNARDGGIGGEKIVVESCEFGYSTEIGLECYKKNAGRSLVWIPLSTELAYYMIEATRQTGEPIVTTGYGRTEASDGAAFPNVFNFPANYWHGAAAQIRHIKENTPRGDMRGMKIALVHHDSPYGEEPLKTLGALAAQEGFELRPFPVPHPGLDQGAIWDGVKDWGAEWTLLWGWGPMNRVALKAAIARDIPVDRVFGNWWSGMDFDLKRLGRRGAGYRAINFHAVGTEYSVYNALNEHVYFAGKAFGLANNLGSTMYNRGLFTAAVVAEGIRAAQKLHGTAQITPRQMRDGLEQVNMSAARLAALGFEGFMPPFANSCAEHGGSGKVAVNQWDSRLRGWRQVSAFYDPPAQLVGALVRAHADGYLKATGRTRRACD